MYVAQQAPGHLDVDGLRAFVEEQLRNIARATAEMESITSGALGTLQTPPVVRVSLATQQAIAAGVFVKVGLDTVEFDTHAWWDAVNKRYTPLRAGYYRFSWQVFGGTSTTLTRVLSALFKNGAVAPSGHGSDFTAGAGIGLSAGTTVVAMNGTTDFVELDALIAAAAPVVGTTGSPFLVHLHGNWLRSL